jgi:hypothetical protein
MYYLNVQYSDLHETYIVSLDVKMSEINSNSPLRRGQNFPDTVLVGWIQVWEGRRDDGSIGGVGHTSTGILTKSNES